MCVRHKRSLTDSPLRCESRWRQSRHRSGSLVRSWWRAAGGRGVLRLWGSNMLLAEEELKKAAQNSEHVPLMKELSDPLSGSMQAPPGRTSTFSRPSSSADTCDGVVDPPRFFSNSARRLLAAENGMWNIRQHRVLWCFTVLNYGRGGKNRPKPANRRVKVFKIHGR